MKDKFIGKVLFAVKKQPFKEPFQITKVPKINVILATLYMDYGITSYYSWEELHMTTESKEIKQWNIERKF